MGSARSRRGSTMLEFALAGIPVIFVVISTLELARGMWIYHSLAFATKTAARFAVVRGRGCQGPGNGCGIAVGDVARRLASAATGLPPDSYEATLESAAGTVECRPVSACLTDPTAWPPAGANVPGMDIRLSTRHLFHSGMAIFWPGNPARRAGAVWFLAASRQRIQF